MDFNRLHAEQIALSSLTRVLDHTPLLRVPFTDTSEYHCHILPTQLKPLSWRMKPSRHVHLTTPLSRAQECSHWLPLLIHLGFSLSDGSLFSENGRKTLEIRNPNTENISLLETTCYFFENMIFCLSCINIDLSSYEQPLNKEMIL